MNITVDEPEPEIESEPPLHTYFLSHLPNLASGAVVLVILLLITGVVFPAVVLGVSQVAFPNAANGSLIHNADGQVIGSELIGQTFTEAKYFHSRPSAAGSDGYDASASGGANLAPTNTDLTKAVGDRAAAYRQENGLEDDVQLPADAVTTSASGLDPHISKANAYLQARRVAAARNLSEDRVRALIDGQASGRLLGFLGEPRVNVLMLNLSLDRESK